MQVCRKRKTDDDTDSVSQSNDLPESTTLDCEDCNVKFPSHADLVQHNQYHQGTHRYLCRICNRAYQSNPGRLKHEQFEHGSTPLLQCDSCGKQFKRKDRLKDHIATKHSAATPHSCPYCSSAFKLRDYLRKHVNQYHPGKALALTPLGLKSGADEVDEGETVTVTGVEKHSNVAMKLSDLVQSKNNDKTLTLTTFNVKDKNGVSSQFALAEKVQSMVEADVDSDSEMNQDENNVIIDTDGE